MGVDDDPGGWGRTDWWGDEPNIEPPTYIPPSPETEDLATYIAFALRDLAPRISRAQTGSIYIRFGTTRSIGALRIADHPGYIHYRYKWNLIDGLILPHRHVPMLVDDDGVIRRYYTWEAVDRLIEDIRKHAHPTLPRGSSMKKIGERLPEHPVTRKLRQAKKVSAKTEEPDPFDEPVDLPEERDDPDWTPQEDFPAEVTTTHTRSRSGQADEQLPAERIFEGRPYVAEDSPGPHGEVEVSIGETINTGNYNSVRVHVGVRIPVEQGEEEEAILFAEAVAIKHVERIAKPYRKG